jgi:hypothetical protein
VRAGCCGKGCCKRPSPLLLLLCPSLLWLLFLVPASCSCHVCSLPLMCIDANILLPPPPPLCVRTGGGHTRPQLSLQGRSQPPLDTAAPGELCKLRWCVALLCRLLSGRGTRQGKSHHDTRHIVVDRHGMHAGCPGCVLPCRLLRGALWLRAHVQRERERQRERVRGVVAKGDDDKHYLLWL